MCIYDRDTNFIDQGRPRCSIVKDPHIGLTTLTSAPDLKATFDRYGIGWIGEISVFYCPQVVREFYASYIVFVDQINLDEGRAQDQLLLTHTLVIGVRVYSSKETIYRFLFGPKLMGLATVAEFDYRLWL